MNTFQKSQAAKMLACYITPEELEDIEKAHPVGYTNKYGQQKQVDGTWKYVGKKKAGGGKSSTHLIKEKDVKTSEPEVKKDQEKPKAKPAKEIDIIKELRSVIETQLGSDNYKNLGNNTGLQYAVSSKGVGVHIDSKRGRAIDLIKRALSISKPRLPAGYKYTGNVISNDSRQPISIDKFKKEVANDHWLNEYNESEYSGSVTWEVTRS